MKTKLRIFALTLCITGLIHPSCKKDDHVKPVTQKLIERLNGSWKAIEVKSDDVLQDEYDNFTLTLSGNSGNKSLNFTAENRAFVSPWDETGIFLFDPVDPVNILLRDDDVIITYEVTGNSLTMSFSFLDEGYVNNKTSSLTGLWEFKFTKQ